MSARDNRVEIAGASSDARLVWAARRVGEGVSSKCWEGMLSALSSIGQ